MPSCIKMRKKYPAKAVVFAPNAIAFATSSAVCIPPDAIKERLLFVEVASIIEVAVCMPQLLK